MILNVESVLYSHGCILFFGIVVGAYVGVNLAAYLQGKTALRSAKGDYTGCGPMLVVVAHQDDETIVAGGAMRKTIAKGGEVFVVYTTDGVTRVAWKSPERIGADIRCREREAINCLESIGVPESHIHFLRNVNETGLLDPDAVVRAVSWLTSFIDTIRPYAIVTSSFEGGHVDHDVTNFIVAKATAQASHRAEHVLEAPEYNRYYLRESLFRYLNRFLIVRFQNFPRFLPSGGKGCVLEMSKDELWRKRRMFWHFGTWDPPGLIGAFGFPDQYRKLPNYSYEAGPFDNTRTWRSWFARVRYGGGKGAHAFFREITLDHYRKVYPQFEAACSEYWERDGSVARPIDGTGREAIERM